MNQEYGDDFITITDEDGANYELEVLSSLEYNGSTYLALVAAGELDTEEDDTDLEVSFLKVAEEDGEEILLAIEDEEELACVYNLFIEQSYEEEE